MSFRVHGGKVHGVFFRDFVQRKANEHRLTGFVKNAPKEKVEGEAQGTTEHIERLLGDLNKGPSAAHVVKVENWPIQPVEGETGFEVAPSEY